MHRVVGRSSKRLRGETVETLSVFDDPEAAARRLRQAMQTDPTTNPNPAANPSRQHRAVHFQEPSALPSEPAALREGEDELLPEEEHVKHMDDVDGTPHTGVTHPGLEPSSGASGLRLSLSTTTSAAQPPGSAAQASHVHTAAEPLQVPLTAQNVHSPSGAKPSHLHSATHTQDAAAQHPHSGPHQQSMAQPAGNSSSAALHAVPAEDAPMPQAPNTAGRAVASSQDSLRIAAERAAAIASLQAVAAAGVAATTSFSVGSPAANAAGAVPETALHQMHAASGAGANGVTDRDIGITNQDSRQAPALLHGEDQMQLDRDITLSGGVSEAQKPGQLQRARRQEEVQRDDDSTVLASTTRPNVPDNKRVTIMAGKSMPTHQKTSTNKQVEVRHDTLWA